MITWDRFLSLVVDPDVLGRRIDEDQSQQDAVKAPADQSLFIVAGPGSGKTTVLTLRVLKLIFVDDVDPGAILATTFTRKAAGELRSRILGWGDDLRNAIVRDPSIPWALASSIRRLDLNRIITGTLDSIAEQTLAEFRAPGTQPPIPLEEFVAAALMQRFGLWRERRYQEAPFISYVKSLTGSSFEPGQKELLNFCMRIRDRFLHDQIDVQAFQDKYADTFPGVLTLCQAIDAYAAKLEEDLVMDFASLEHEFLRRLTSRLLDRFLEPLRVVLVDEYQDTNYLQEQIYFCLARSVVERFGSFAVVGDDDQSLYRFRGATVELFAGFPDRLQAQHSLRPEPIYLSNNYRSTRTIVNFYSDFVNLDMEYSPARVVGKPPLAPARGGTFLEYPILGMFRPELDILARDLAVFIHDVFNGVGVTIPFRGQSLQIIKDPLLGAIGDCALLCSSPQEYGYDRKIRLPLRLRQELATRPNPIEVFNPRGQDLAEIPVVQQLCGLLLECIDPDARIQDSISTFPRRNPDVRAVFNNWRHVARDFIASNPRDPNPQHTGLMRLNTLSRFVVDWQKRQPRETRTWPSEVPLIHLVYELVAWIPALQNDPEGIVYLEAITRTITQSARFIAYNATIQRDDPHAERSIKHILRGIFEPLAAGAIEVSEELIEALPRNRLNILSIHQSKGLEFPLVIVDVSSDIKTDHRMNAFKRFPRDGASPPFNLEDLLRPFSPLGAPTRRALDRAFDDLVRRFFVAYSRPQDVLLLVGLGQPSGEPHLIRNVGFGWTRAGYWPWQGLPDLVFI